MLSILSILIDILTLVVLFFSFKKIKNNNSTNSGNFNASNIKGNNVNINVGDTNNTTPSSSTKNNTNKVTNLLTDFIIKNKKDFFKFEQSELIINIIKDITEKLESINELADSKLLGLTKEKQMDLIKLFERNFVEKCKKIFKQLDEYFNHDSSSLEALKNQAINKGNLTPTESNRLLEVRQRLKRNNELKENSEVVLNELMTLFRSLAHLEQTLEKISNINEPNSSAEIDLVAETSSLINVLDRISEL